MHLDFAGHSKLLIKPVWHILTLEASPDGKYFAFGPGDFELRCLDDEFFSGEVTF